ncbi:MAG: hypothetical protein J5874_01285 [Oscillospiraceae bacterium]|nr:hypothetical protein [Oscillospiraceae bacterium]
MADELKEVILDKNGFLTYKDKPLVRNGNYIYYGNMSDDYVVMMQILSKKQNGDIEQADKIMIQLISTDESLPITQRIIKRSEKEGLYNAIEIANIWLERILSEK